MAVRRPHTAAVRTITGINKSGMLSRDGKTEASCQVSIAAPAQKAVPAMTLVIWPQLGMRDLWQISTICPAAREAQHRVRNRFRALTAIIHLRIIISISTAQRSKLK